MDNFINFAGSIFSSIVRGEGGNGNESGPDRQLELFEAADGFITAMGIKKEDMGFFGEILYRKLDSLKYETGTAVSLEGDSQILYRMYKESNSGNFMEGGFGLNRGDIDMKLNKIFEESGLTTYLQDDGVILREGKVCRIILCRIFSSNTYHIEIGGNTEAVPRVRHEDKVLNSEYYDSVAGDKHFEEDVFRKYPSNECFGMISTLLRTSNSYEILKESCSSEGIEDFMDKELNYYKEIFPEIIKHAEKWVSSHQTLIKPCD